MSREKAPYTQVPNKIMERVIEGPMDRGQIKILLWVVRNSIGRRRRHWTEPVNIRTLSEGLGMSKTNIHLALSVLIEEKILVRGAGGKLSLTEEWNGYVPVPPVGQEESVLSHRRDALVPPAGQPILIVKKERNTDSGEEPQTAKAGPKPKGTFNVFMDRFFEECLAMKPGDPAQRAKVSAAYRRYGRAGKDVLAMSDGEPEKAIACVHAIGFHLESRGLSWTLDTIAKHALDYYQNPAAYGGPNGRR